MDAIKALMIFFVVYWHVSIFTGTTDSPVNTMFMPFYLTLFFFISGYFSFVRNKLALNDVGNRIIKRVKTLFIPTLIMCTLYSIYSGKNAEEVLFNDMKGGYWFTFVAFEIYVFYMAVQYVLKPTQRDRNGLWIYLVIMALFSLLTLIGYRWENWSVYRLFSVYQVFKYIPFFFLGAMCRQFQTQFFKLLRNDIFILLSLVGMISLYIFHSRPSIWLQGYLGIFLVFAVFLKFEGVFNRSSGYVKFTLTVGKSTLIIYFLHYFLLSGISVLAEPFQHIMARNGWVVNALLTSATAIVLITICLVAGKMLTISPSLHQLCFGSKEA